MGRVPGYAKTADGTPQQPITYLWERHREIIRRLVAGDKQVDIARDMEMTQGRLSIICNSPACQNLLKRISAGADEVAKDVQTRIQELSNDAITILETAILNGKNEGLSFKAQTDIAKDVLDRAGHGSVKKIQSVDVVLTGSDIEEMRLRSRQNREKVINAECTA